jgi:hypothetical protein
MKRFKFFTTLMLTMLMIAATAVAETPEKITFHALFDFTVANRTLPAGNYTIRPLSPTRLLIRSDDGQESLIVSTFAAQASRTPNATSVIFARYGDQYFLYQIFAQGTDTGRQLSRSQVEVEMAKTAAPVMVPVAGR